MGSSTKVTFKWAGWKRGGYAEVVNSEGVQSELDKFADRAANSANATFSPAAGESDGYGVSSFQGHMARGRVITTLTPHAAASERKHNRLQGAFGGGA